MLNVVAVMGRLARDPEMRQTTTGKNVVSFSRSKENTHTAQSAAPTLSHGSGDDYAEIEDNGDLPF